MLKRDKIVQPKKKRKGQSTIEYIILLAAIIAGFLIFLTPGGPFNKAINETIKTGLNKMINMSNKVRVGFTS